MQAKEGRFKCVLQRNRIICHTVVLGTSPVNRFLELIAEKVNLIPNPMFIPLFLLEAVPAPTF